jgi:hypothetical protein
MNRQSKSLENLNRLVTYHRSLSQSARLSRVACDKSDYLPMTRLPPTMYSASRCTGRQLKVLIHNSIHCSLCHPLEGCSAAAV